MKRRDFLKVLGITATTPVLGSVTIPTPVAVPEVVKPVKVPKIKPMPSQFLNNKIYFKNIGTFGLDDHSMSITEHRGITEYHSLTGNETVKVPSHRGANMDVRIYATTKEMNKFKHYFDKFEAVEEVGFELQGLAVSAKDVVIESISVVQEMDKPLALDLTLMLETEKVTMKEIV